MQSNVIQVIYADMKSYVDIGQSSRLAKILPIESADLIYIMYHNGEKPQNGDANLSTVYESDEHKWYWINIRDESWDMRIGEDIPCWSLASLLSVLPNEVITENRFECHYQIKIRKYDGGDNTTLYQIAYGNSRGSSGSWHDMINTGEKENLIDACVDMIEELHKLNLLQLWITKSKRVINV